MTSCLHVMTWMTSCDITIFILKKFIKNSICFQKSFVFTNCDVHIHTYSCHNLRIHVMMCALTHIHVATCAFMHIHVMTWMMSHDVIIYKKTFFQKIISIFSSHGDVSVHIATCIFTSWCEWCFMTPH